MPGSSPARRRGCLAPPVRLSGALGLMIALGSMPAAHATLAQSQVFASWTPFANGADVTLTSDATIKHGGARSLKFINATSTSPNNGGFFQTVTAQPSTLYQLKAWVQGSNVAAGFTDCFGINQNFATLTCVPSGTYGWQQITWNYTTTASETAISLALYSQNTGTVWFDDLSIVKNGTTANLLANPGFETFADSITISSPDNTVFPTGGGWLQVSSTAASINWTSADYNGVQVGSGTVNTATGPGTLVLPAVGPGWYSLHLATPTNGIADSTYSVVADSYINNSAKPNAFGANIHPYTAVPGEVAAVGSAGLSNIRIDLRWEQIETSPGVYTFSPATDQMIGFLLGGNVRPLVTLGYSNPLYDGGHVPSTPSGLAAYAAYAAAVARHFDTRVDYDIFNEYNVAGTNNSACGITADCYVALLMPTANAIHGAVAGTRIVGPSLGGFTQDWIGSNPDSYTWLRRFLDIGGLAYLDVVAIHNYTFPVITPPEGNNDAVITAVRNLLATYSGGSSKPFWLTETGFPPYAGLISEQDQAQWVVRDAALAVRAGVAQYVYYDLLDDCADANNGACRFGLMHNVAETAGTLAPRPGYTAYAVLARKLAGYAYASSDNWGSGIYALAFADGSGAKRRVAWAPGGNTTLAIQSSAAVTVTNWDGRSSVLSPVGGIVTFSVGRDAVYVEGSAITGGGIAATPAFSATPPGVVHRNQAVSIAVAVNGAATGSATGSITFRSDYGSTSVTASAGTTVSGTLVLGGFPNTGPVTVPVEVVRSGSVIGRLVVSMNVTP